MRRSTKTVLAVAGAAGATVAARAAVLYATSKGLEILSSISEARAQQLRSEQSDPRLSLVAG